MLLLLLRLILRGGDDKARTEHRAGSEEAVVANADRGEVATDGNVFFHDALCSKSGGERRRGRWLGIRAEGPQDKKR